MSDNPHESGTDHGDVFKDPRLDRLVTWTLTAVAGVALTFGAYFFKALDARIASLDSTISGLRSQIAVLENDARRMALLEARLLALEAGGAAPTRAQIIDIKERLAALEQRR